MAAEDTADAHRSGAVFTEEAITTVVQGLLDKTTADRRAPAGNGGTPSGKCGKWWLASGPGWRTRLSADKAKEK